MEKSQRSLIEIIERARPSVHDAYVRRLVDGGLLPTSVHSVTFQNTAGDAKAREFRAKSARWLAVLKRDYPTEYQKLITETSDTTTQ